MSYIALYRKYRPKIFDEVHGQSAIVQTLKNQIKSNRIGHAYLFSGPRGTGKTSVSKIFAKTINCENPIDGNPCLQCECCKKFANDLNLDIIEIDAASNNGVDNIRSLIEESKYMPQYGKYKVYIVDEVHMLSNSAFNALLKTLEEPTRNVVFILATTEEHKVPATIYSRCQHYQFKLINNDDIVNALKYILVKESIKWDSDDSLLHLAKLAKGGLRDAISLLDQCIIFSSGELTKELIMEVFGEVDNTIIADIVNVISNKDICRLIDIVQEQERNGKHLSRLCDDLYEYYRDEYFNLSNNTTKTIYERYMKILATLSEKMKYNNSRALFEIEMIKLCKPEMETDYNSLNQRIYDLEKTIGKLINGQIVTSTSNNQVNHNNDFINMYIHTLPKVSINIYNI